MDELRRSLQVLVARPPVAPVSVEFVAARSARFTRRRWALRGTAGLALVVASAVGLGVAQQGSDPGVILGTAGQTSAGYIAEKPGGYIATGTWRLTITRGSELIELNSTSSEHCAPMGVILPGDEVRGSITGPDSSLLVGERFSCP